MYTKASICHPERSLPEILPSLCSALLCSSASLRSAHLTVQTQSNPEGWCPYKENVNSANHRVILWCSHRIWYGHARTPPNVCRGATLRPSKRKQFGEPWGIFAYKSPLRQPYGCHLPQRWRLSNPNIWRNVGEFVRIVCSRRQQATALRCKC